MQQRKWRRGWIERLFGKMQHYRAVFADGIHHDRLGRLGGNLAHDVNTLGF